MEPSVLEQQVGVFFDDQAIDSLDELATLYNLRVSRTQQLLLETKEVHDIDTRVRRMGVYLQRHNAQLKAFTQECIEQDTPLDAGDVFSHAMVAFNSQDATWIAKLVTHYKDDPHARDGIVYALFYLPWGVASQWVADFLRSKEMAHKWLGVKACRLRNVYPGKLIRSLINRDDCQADVALYEQLLLLIGQMHDKSAASLVFNALEHDDESIKTAAYTASLMHNNKHVVSGAITHSLTTNAAFHALSPWIILGNTSAFANPYLSQVMAQTHIDYDLKIRAIGHHGDPATLAWLIKNTQADHLQPWVGLVFTQITGLDITAYSLTKTVAQCAVAIYRWASLFFGSVFAAKRAFFAYPAPCIAYHCPASHTILHHAN